MVWPFKRELAREHPLHPPKEAHADEQNTSMALLPKVALLESWPKPDSVSDAIVFANERELALLYVESRLGDAIVHFPLVCSFRFGHPNDEVLSGHPLARAGLQCSSVHRVENSPWISELEIQNSVHPRHDKKRFLHEKVHYIFTFQDSTLEVIAYQGTYHSPDVQVYSDKQLAKNAWRVLLTKLNPGILGD